MYRSEMNLSELLDGVVIGGGPAGLTAASYASRMGMRILLLERYLLGGRAVEAQIIENFPGFPEGISGAELIEKMVKQVEKFHADVRFPEKVDNLALNSRVKSIISGSRKYRSLSVIIATGTQRKKLSVPGETKLLGVGVSYCAICDGPLFKGKATAVIGSGNEAFHDALYLSSLSSKVTVITEKEEIEADKKLADECNEKSSIDIVKGKVESILGNSKVESIVVADLDSNASSKMPVEGVFISTGRAPMTKIAEKAGILLDEKGCIKTDRRQSTNVNGVFAAGDCTCGGMQMVTAVGEGAMAAIQAYRYVKNSKNSAAP
jgi:thioredoxin reductase (NADPH)